MLIRPAVPRRDRALAIANLLLQAIFWLNIVSAIGFAGFLIYSTVWRGSLSAMLARKYAGRLDIDQLIGAMQMLFALGLVAVVVAWFVITRLQAIIATVSTGDPFVASNAARLRTIGWALLAWQVIDLAFGGISFWIGRIGADTSGWTPALSGWLVVALVFVLARVFAVGAAMRDDLEGTV